MRKQILMAVLAMSLTLLSFAFSDETTNPKYYDNAKVVRVRYVSGEGTVKRSYDDGLEEATINLPLFENDEVTTTDGHLEIYLGRLNYLRLDSDTHLRLTRLPYPQKTDLAVRMEKGGVYLEVENLDFEKGIEVQTPDCGIFLLDRGTYRINVMETGRTEVFVYKGLAEVAGNDVSRNVRENQKIVMASGEIEQRPFYFYASDRDDFDSWNEERSRELGYAQYGSARYLQSGYEDYENELSRNGRWSYMDEFHEYCWIPYNVDVDWRPYYYGHWIWNPYYGYVWSSYDSWGWFTHYYGRWHWHDHWGWYWIPGYHWSPAWVSWWWDDYYYGWCPLSWWNTPVFVINDHWDRHYDWHRGLPNHSRSSIIIRKGELINPNIRRVAISGNELASVSSRSLAFRGNGPAEKPLISKVAVLNGAGKTVFYKQSGIVSANKFQTVRSGSVGKDNETTPSLRYVGTSGNNRAVVKYSGSKSAERAGIRRSAADDRSGYSSRVSKRKSDSSSDSGSGSRSSSSDRSSGRSSGSVSKTSGDKGSSQSSSSSGSSGSTAKKKKDEEYYSSRFSSGSELKYSSPSNSSYVGKYSRKGGIAYSSLPDRKENTVTGNELKKSGSSSSYGYVSRSQTGNRIESSRGSEGLAVLRKMLSGEGESGKNNTSSRVTAREYSYPANSSSSSSVNRYAGQSQRSSSGMEVLRKRLEAEDRNFRTNDYRSVRTSPSSPSGYSSSYSARESSPSIRYRNESSDRGSSSIFGGISHRSSSSPSFGSSSSSHSSSVSSHSSSSSGHSSSVSSHSSSSHSSGGHAVKRRD